MIKQVNNKLIIVNTINVWGYLFGRVQELDAVAFNSQNLSQLSTKDLYSHLPELPDIVAFPECGLPVMLMLKSEGKI